MAYCEPGDLLLGQIPLPSYINPQSKVQDAADEIDSMIGFIYVTPINTDEGSTVPRPARLLLKRINSHLATGRLVMETSSSQEDRELHEYGASLVRQAYELLQKIASGEVVIEGAIQIEVEPSNDNRIYQKNKDEVSQVDAFYDYFGSPSRGRTGTYI